MKILFLGDSITDMRRNKEQDAPEVFKYGSGYVFFAAGELISRFPNKYEVINRGISGNRSIDLYARIKADVWNEAPDVLSILVGVNDIWHEINFANGVEIDRYEKIYRMIIDDTLERLPDVKIMLMEPFILDGRSTAEKEDKFRDVYEYAKVVKKLADEYGFKFVPLQEKLSKAAAENGAENYLHDGVHPAIAGAKLIADEWLKAFDEYIK